jgi:hypothetical protein
MLHEQHWQSFVYPQVNKVYTLIYKRIAKTMHDFDKYVAALSRQACPLLFAVSKLLRQMGQRQRSSGSSRRYRIALREHVTPPELSEQQLLLAQLPQPRGPFVS